LEPIEQDDDLATPDELRQAIESLRPEELYKLKKAATYCLFGSEYQSEGELFNETIMRAMRAADGERGRAWRKSVNFMAFLITCMRGIANDSAESFQQTRIKRIEELATETNSGEEVLAVKGHRHPSHEDFVIELEEARERAAKAKADAGVIENYFVNDSQVSWLIMGYKDGLAPHEVREISEMTQTEYDTAKRRFRRGLDKLFPGRRAK
jgi:DNA-directed RNA polymerase specialized sigma24 family protein